MAYKGPLIVKPCQMMSKKRMAAISNSLAKKVGRRVVFHCGNYMFKGKINRVGSDSVKLTEVYTGERHLIWKNKEGLLPRFVDLDKKIPVRIVRMPGTEWKMQRFWGPLVVAIRTIRPQHSYYL